MVLTVDFKAYIEDTNNNNQQVGDVQSLSVTWS